MARRRSSPSSRASEDSTSPSNASGSAASAKSKVTSPVSASLPSDGPASSDGATCEAWAIEAVGRKMSGGPEVGLGIQHEIMFTLDRDSKHSVALISSAAASRAKAPALPESDSASPTTARRSSGKSVASRTRSTRRGGCSRMFQGSVLSPSDAISKRCLPRLKSAGLWSDGGLWTASMSEAVRCTTDPACPNEGVACSLSAVLMKRALPKYFLSPKAAAGILRRAAKRGRALPVPLAAALTALADATKTTPTPS